MRSRLFQTIVVVGASLTGGCASNPISTGAVVDGGATDLTGDLSAWSTIDSGLPVGFEWPIIDMGWPTIMVPRDMTRVPDAGD